LEQPCRKRPGRSGHQPRKRPLHQRAFVLSAASNYFRAASTFLIGAPIDPRVVHTYRRHRAAFEQAAALMHPPAEPILIPYAGASLHGYMFRAADHPTSRPTLIVNGGYDSTAEEAYLFSGAAAVARGYTCIVFERAASAEPRLAACIADPGEYSLLEEFKSRIPAFVARELPAENW
jgi:hypothetical protein